MRERDEKRIQSGKQEDTEQAGSKDSKSHSMGKEETFRADRKGRQVFFSSFGTRWGGYFCSYPHYFHQILNHSMVGRKVLLPEPISSP